VLGVSVGLECSEVFLLRLRDFRWLWRLLSYCTWCSVILWIFANISDPSVASIFTVIWSRLQGSFRGRAIAQAVTHWLPTAAARLHARFWSSGICGGQNDTRTGFLRVLRFPMPIFIPPDSPSSQSPGAGTIGQKWPTCGMDPVWTPPPRYAN
jgi:hypothetical protein